MVSVGLPSVPGIEGLSSAVALPRFQHARGQRRIAKELDECRVQVAADALSPNAGADVNLVELTHSCDIDVGFVGRAHR
ncbi:hypothetical protein EV578_12610 [Streptomyces sp. BK205]|nr:hypothetical protein EV578_12610 [Streptomyces sp. BK205]